VNLNQPPIYTWIISQEVVLPSDYSRGKQQQQKHKSCENVSLFPFHFVPDLRDDDFDRKKRQFAISPLALVHFGQISSWLRPNPF